MGLKAKATGGAGGNYVAQPNIDPGSYPARVVSVVDLGVQAQRPYKGESKPPCQMIRVTYELTDVFLVDADGNDVEDKPRWIAEDFKLLAMDADLAVSTKRYKTIDPDNEHDGDWSELLTRGVMVNIVNNEGKDGKVYDNVAGTSVMRKKDLDKLDDLQNTPYFFDLTDPDPEVWAKMPQWLQDKVKENINYEDSPLQAMVDKLPPREDKKPAEKKEAAAKPAKPAKPAKEEPEEDAADEEAPW